MGALTGSLDQLLPGWLTRLDAPITSRDPLGLQATAGRLADDLLPGLNVFTSRARYYSFLSWALRVSDGEIERIHRLERLLVLVESLRHRADPPEACPYIGRRRGVRFVAEGPDPYGWSLPTRVLKNQSVNGAFRLYRTSLVDLGLVEERDDDRLELRRRGEALADRYGRKLNPAVVGWALEDVESHKREAALLETAERMCLSGEIDGHERQHLLSALFLDDHEHAFRRRETARVLLAHGLLDARRPGDVASEDTDAVAEDGGRGVAMAEAQGNWRVLRASLLRPPASDLLAVQQAAAYECLAVALNGIFGAVLDAVASEGRVRLSTVTARLARTQRSFGDLSGDPLHLTDEVLGGKPRALELLGAVTRDPRMRELLEPLSGEPLVALALGLDPDHSARDVAHDLAIELTLHHHGVAARKGKGQWVVHEGDSLVRREAHLLPPLVHTMRLVQLQQLILDLALDEKEMASAA